MNKMRELRVRKVVINIGVGEAGGAVGVAVDGEPPRVVVPADGPGGDEAVGLLAQDQAAGGHGVERFLDGVGADV